MRVVKLDNRWKVYKDGFTTVMRFDSYSAKVAEIERWCYDTIGSQYGNDCGWRGYFGKSPQRHLPRPYYVAFKDEAYISAILLADLN